MASFLYSGKMENLSSIVFHTVILKMLSKEAKSRNVASFLYSEIMEILPSILYPTLSYRKAFKRAKNEEMWLRFYVEYKIGVCIIDTFPHCHEMLSKGAKSRNVASFLYSGTMEYVSSIVFHTVILVGSKSHCRAVPAGPSPIWCGSNLIFIDDVSFKL